jgi:hypothetical protein
MDMAILSGISFHARDYTLLQYIKTFQVAAETCIVFYHPRTQQAPKPSKTAFLH